MELTVENTVIDRATHGSTVDVYLFVTNTGSNNIKATH